MTNGYAKSMAQHEANLTTHRVKAYLQEHGLRAELEATGGVSVEVPVTTRSGARAYQLEIIHSLGEAKNLISKL